MRLLLDTHVALWMVEGNRALTPAGRTRIEDAREIVLSVVTPWELTIKATLGKIQLRYPPERLFQELEREFGVHLLPIRLEHVLEVGRLPLHHGDPFDRLLLAQARHEGLTLLSHDSAFGRYDVPLILI